MKFVFIGTLTLSFLWNLPLLAAGPKSNWLEAWAGIPELVQSLASVPAGLSLLRRANEKGFRLSENVKLGSKSQTESTFSRSYSLLTGEEQIEVHQVVYVNRRLSKSEAVVDLAHELVHFSEKEIIDPYRPSFAIVPFVRQGIEGPGGELAAFEAECILSWQLEQTYAGFPSHRLCSAYRGAGNQFLRESARHDYYAVGDWFRNLEEGYRTQIPDLNQGPVRFLSSVAGRPYPVALFEEFQETKRSACANNKRKYRLVMAQVAKTEAGNTKVLLQREQRRLQSYEKTHCNMKTELQVYRDELPSGASAMKGSL